MQYKSRKIHTRAAQPLTAFDKRSIVQLACNNTSTS